MYIYLRFIDVYNICIRLNYSYRNVHMKNQRPAMSISYRDIIRVIIPPYYSSALGWLDFPL